MSRSVLEIYDALNQEKATMSQLNEFVVNAGSGSTQDTAEDLIADISSASKVAKWRVWLFMMAVASWMVEVLFDRHVVDVDARLAAKRPHTLKWYEEQAKMFQYGYEMIFNDGAFSYSQVDDHARIVKYARAREKNGKIIIKVATIVSGQVVPLTMPQLSALQLFFTRWKDAGVVIEFVNQPSDLVKINMKVTRDRLVLDSANNLLRDPSINPLRLAIQGYEQGLEFDGVFIISGFVDAIQKAEGIVDEKIIQAWIKPYDGDWVEIDMSTEAESGYFTLSYSNSIFTFIDSTNVEVLAQ